MNYKEVRPLLKTGQSIGVKESKSVLNKFTRFFTYSEYTHTGIVQVDSSGAYLAELNGGKNHKIPMSQLMNKSFDVYECPPECLQDIDESINRWLRYEIHYGLLAFIAIGFMKFFNFSFKIKLKHSLVCSGLCINMLSTANWSKTVDVLTSPGDYLAELKLLYKVN